MPELNIPGIYVFGRPFKPLSFGMALVTLTLFVSGLVNTSTTGTSVWGDVMSGISLVSFGLLNLGWWLRSQSLGEWGLLFASWTMLSRAIVIWLFFGDVGMAEAWLNFSWAIATAGAYWLERVDPITGSVARSSWGKEDKR